MIQIPDDRLYTVTALLSHGRSAQPTTSSCFGARQPHVLFHINARDTPEWMHEASKWANKVASNLYYTGQTMKSTYVSFMEEGEQTKESFEGNWEELQALKRDVDPDNVFVFAQPKLGY